MDIRYFAGIVDGEGSIGAHRQVHRGSRRPSFRIRLRVVNTSLDLVETIRASYGGNIYYSNPPGNRKRMAEWCLSGRPALGLIRRMLPYLIVKRQRALEALRFEPLIRWHGGVALSDSAHQERVALYNSLKAMNYGSKPRAPCVEVV